jgi:hypothetical protein
MRKEIDKKWMRVLRRGPMMSEDLAACAQMSHAQIVLPVHHDSMQVKGKETCREWVNKANEYLIEHDSVSRAAYLQKYKWYDLAVGISLKPVSGPITTNIYNLKGIPATDPNMPNAPGFKPNAAISPAAQNGSLTGDVMKGGKV